MINVSLLRDGTRSTVRQFQISRSALDRHKHHLTASVEFPIDGSGDHRAAPTPEALSETRGDLVLSQLEVMIRRSENAINQALADRDFRIVMPAMREQRAQLELKNKIVSERLKHSLFAGRPDQKSPTTPSSTTEHAREQLLLVTLRIRINLASRKLGEWVCIEEPSNLEYLEQKFAALSARLEQRKLLSMSRGLATIQTYVES